MAVELAKHQRDALQKMHNGCILWGGVGSGKSRVALAYYMEVATFSALIVITTAKKRDSMDWRTEAARFGIGPSEDSTLAGTITVDSWHNIYKYTDCENCFFIFDEQRLVGGGKWVRSFLKITKFNQWIMLTATPGDTWIDYIPVFIANGFYKNRTEFKRDHVIYNTYAKFPKVDRYVGVQKLVKHRSEILVHMLYRGEAVRETKTYIVPYDQELLKQIHKKRWDIYKDRPLRDAGEMWQAMRRLVNSDPSRLAAVKETADKHERLLVFYNFDYELEILRSLSPSYTVAEWNGHRHEDIPDTEKWIYLVQYMAGAEGWNCTSANATLFYSLTYSYKIWHQAHGRTDRMNTPYAKLFYYILRSKSMVDEGVYKALMAKKNFNESLYVKSLAKFKS